MLQLTPETLTYLRQHARAAEARQREKIQRKAEERKRRLSKERQDTLVSVVARLLQSGTPTRFEYEGACRHGLRSSLILEGWRWYDADRAASDVVAAALSAIGATRPTWLEGQPETAANAEWLRYYCARCGNPIPEERKVGGRTKFCSNLCVMAESARRSRITGERASRAEWLASCASKSADRVLDLTKDCENCGTTFIADRSKNRFCSYVCSAQGVTKHPKLPCDNCGDVFQTRTVRSGKLRVKQLTKFCSRSCSDAGRSRSWGSKKSSFECAEIVR